MADSPTWRITSRTIAKCIFIDLGAGGGNTFETYLHGRYGTCPSGGEWEAWLVEASPHFDQNLTKVERLYSGRVHPLSSTAAYQCNGTVKFSVDGVSSEDCDRCSSSMKHTYFGNHGPAVENVTVPTINVIQLIAEHVIPDDFVILKSDIEGAEYDVFPCLAQSKYAHLLDSIYLEEHPYLQKRSVYSPEEYAAAMAALHSMDIYMPHYRSDS